MTSVAIGYPFEMCRSRRCSSVLKLHASRDRHFVRTIRPDRVAREENLRARFWLAGEETPFPDGGGFSCCALSPPYAPGGLALTGNRRSPTEGAEQV